jgi:hypothetical protein
MVSNLLCSRIKELMMMDQDETNLAGEEVSIYDGDTFVGNAPVVDGRWQYTVPSLSLGGHDFNARVGPLTSNRWSVTRVSYADFTDFEGGNLNGWVTTHWWEGEVHQDPDQGSVGKFKRILGAVTDEPHVVKPLKLPAKGRYMFQASLKGSHAGMTVAVGWMGEEFPGSFQLTTEWRTYSVEAPMIYGGGTRAFCFSVKGPVGDSFLADNISITRIG